MARSAGADDEIEDEMDGWSQPGGPGWWVASNGLWYPPESHPDSQSRRGARYWLHRSVGSAAVGILAALVITLTCGLWMSESTATRIGAGAFVILTPVAFACWKGLATRRGLPIWAWASIVLFGVSIPLAPTESESAQDVEVMIMAAAPDGFGSEPAGGSSDGPSGAVVEAPSATPTPAPSVASAESTTAERPSNADLFRQGLVAADRTLGAAFLAMPDDDVDALADSVCGRRATAATEDEFTSELQILGAKRGFDLDQMGEIAASAVVYCPDVFETDLAAASPAPAPTPPPTATPPPAATAVPPMATPVPPPPTPIPPPATPVPPPPPPPPPPPVPQPSQSCTPGYSPCIPPGPDVDCAGGSGNGPRYVQGPVQVTGSDPYGLDRDKDGIGCE